MHQKVSQTFCVSVFLRIIFQFALISIAANAQMSFAKAADTVEFAVIGDYGTAAQELKNGETERPTHPNGRLAEEVVADLVKSWDTNNELIILTVGDNNYRYGSEATIDDNIGQYYCEYIFNYQPKEPNNYCADSDPNRSARFFPAIGNHDWLTNSIVDINGVPTPMPTVYTDYFTLPTNPNGHELYYSVRKGPVEFFMLDSDIHQPDGYTSDSAQANWLRQKLATSTATWKFVFLHHAPYSSGAIHGNDPYLENLRWPFSTWGADAVFGGHDHIYERLEIENIAYFVNGVGGDRPINDFLDVLVEGSQARYNGDNGAMRVTANLESATFEFFNTVNELIDSHTIAKNTSPTISQNQWQLVGVDSEEVVAGDFRATKAFDGNPNTFWHTSWTSGDDPYPHHIQIDLGANYNISGFKYLPRQSNANGRINEFEFFTSVDGLNWGTAKAKGSFNNSTLEEEVFVRAHTGRYIKLAALNEVYGREWAAIAELNIMGQLTENVAPNITSSPATTAQEGVTYQLDVNATDINPNDILRFSLEIYPIGMTIDQTTGLINWTPTSSQVGDNTVTIVVTDDGSPNLSDRQSFVINTTAVVNTPPNVTIDTPINNVAIFVGDSITFSSTGFDQEDGTLLAYSWDFDGGIPNSSEEDPGELSFPVEGIYIVTLNVTDLAGLQDPTPPSIIISVSLRPQTILIPQTDWQLISVDSEELIQEDGIATNAFDGDINSVWHTAWDNTDIPPHEIQIDLGNYYNINGFQYSPRQDGLDNGNIKQYEFYISTNLSSWGQPVSSGTFEISNLEKNIIFPFVRGRYIKLIALSEINNRAWTSIAELNIWGDELINSAPTITSSPVENALRGDVYNYDVDAIDPDQGDILNYSLIAPPLGMAINTNSGLINWTPNENQIGIHNTTVVVSDNGIPVMQNEQSFTITVNDPNLPPQISSTPITNALSNQSYTYTVDAIDPNAGDNLQFSLSTAPTGMSIDTQSGLIRWLPSAEQVGTHPVTVVAIDDGAPVMQTTQQYNLVVSLENLAPQISSTPVTNALSNQNYTYTVNASDPNDGDSLQFSLSAAPTGMSIEAQSGLIRWLPNTDQVGTHSITIVVMDNGIPALQANQQFSLIVSAENLPPQISSTPITNALSNQNYTYTVNASDPNAGDNLQFSLNTAPTGMSIDAQSGMIRWLPSTDQVGTHSITIVVVDNGAPVMQTTQQFNLVVNLENLAPQINSTPMTNALSNQSYMYAVSASDPNSDNTLTYSLSEHPVGMGIESITGLISWTPNSDQIGTHQVKILVSDNQNPPLFATQEYSLTVSLPINNPSTETDITPPLITLVGDQMIEHPLGEIYSDRGATAFDNVDMDISDKIQIVNLVNINIVGTYTITYDVTDLSGNPAETVIRTVKVENKQTSEKSNDTNPQDEENNSASINPVFLILLLFILLLKNSPAIVMLRSAYRIR